MNAVCTYDLSYKKENGDTEETLRKFFRKYCKKWTFQEEIGESGYEHYQCRFSLKIKDRIGGVIKILHAEGLEKGRLTVTSNENRDNAFYVIKDDTRVKGPWSDITDELPIEVPWDIEGIELRSWQRKIEQSGAERDRRTINVVVDKVGNIGKSTLVKYLGVYRKGRNVPPVSNYKDLMRMAYDIPTASLYLVDVPRAINISSAADFWGGVEELKSGHAWDDRYSYKEKFFGNPSVWVFMNREPDENLMSKDKWKFWQVVNEDLVPYIKEVDKERDRD